MAKGIPMAFQEWLGRLLGVVAVFGWLVLVDLVWLGWVARKSAEPYLGQLQTVLWFLCIMVLGIVAWSTKVEDKFDNLSDKVEELKRLRAEELERLRAIEALLSER